MKFDAIGTSWSIEILTELSASKSRQIEAEIAARIEIYDQTYSRFRPDSLVMRIAATAGQYQMPDDARALISFYRRLYDATDGKVTPLVGQTVADSGYDATYSLTPRPNIPVAPSWDDVMTYEYPSLTVHRPALLDFGAAGKGYLVDILGELLQIHGVSSFLIDAGGDILRRTTDDSTARVGLEHPEHPDHVIGVLGLKNGSVCGSASNRRAWGDRHHIIDPDTTRPVRDVVATWATAPTALEADGLATALFFTPPQVLRACFEFEYCLVRSDASVEVSPGLKAEIFTD